MITCLCHSLKLPLVMAHTGYRFVSQSGLVMCHYLGLVIGCVTIRTCYVSISRSGYRFVSQSGLLCVIVWVWFKFGSAWSFCVSWSKFGYRSVLQSGLAMRHGLGLVTGLCHSLNLLCVMVWVR